MVHVAFCIYFLRLFKRLFFFFFPCWKKFESGGEKKKKAGYDLHPSCNQRKTLVSPNCKLTLYSIWGWKAPLNISGLATQPFLQTGSTRAVCSGLCPGEFRGRGFRSLTRQPGLCSALLKVSVEFPVSRFVPLLLSLNAPEKSLAAPPSLPPSRHLHALLGSHAACWGLGWCARSL